eukprot:TRINITY_DN13824_c0_g1_i3.p1 TRINITY_DN13824_c0_g1~~TRINITY_DN13824_c0_g1_i3.p1  ORF type:complete len:621 (+),score=177.78 TRINITY_DN13824_c0_g1_i3:71-1933(+)
MICDSGASLCTLRCTEDSVLDQVLSTNIPYVPDTDDTRKSWVSSPSGSPMGRRAQGVRCLLGWRNKQAVELSITPEDTFTSLLSRMLESHRSPGYSTPGQYQVFEWDDEDEEPDDFPLGMNTEVRSWLMRGVGSFLVTVKRGAEKDSDEHAPMMRPSVDLLEQRSCVGRLSIDSALLESPMSTQQAAALCAESLGGAQHWGLHLKGGKLVPVKQSTVRECAAWHKDYTPDTIPVRIPCGENDRSVWQDPSACELTDLALLFIRASRDSPISHIITLLSKEFGLLPECCALRFAGVGMQSDLPGDHTLTWFGPNAHGLELLLCVDRSLWQKAAADKASLRCSELTRSVGLANSGEQLRFSSEHDIQFQESQQYWVQLCTPKMEYMQMSISPHQISARLVRRSAGFDPAQAKQHIPLEDRDDDRNFSRLLSDLRTVQPIEGDDRKFMLVFREERQCKHTGFLACCPRERNEIVRQLLQLQGQRINMEWRVVKTNERGRRQARVLGVDSQNVYNYKPQEKRTVLGMLGFKSRGVEKQTRLLSSLQSVSIDDDDPVKFFLVFTEREEPDDCLHYEASSPELCEEIVGRLKKAMHCVTIERKLSSMGVHEEDSPVNSPKLPVQQF